MKKKLIFACILIFILLVGIVLSNYYRNSRQEVTFTLLNPKGSVELRLYKTVQEGDELNRQSDYTVLSDSITNNQEPLVLKKGNYLLVPSGDNIDTAEIPFTLAETPLELQLDIPFTTTYLDALLATELTTITNEISSAYPKSQREYTLQPGKLYHRGEWFAATLTNNEGTEQNVNGDTLRILLHKDAGAWQILTNPPTIVLSAPDYPKVPKDILKNANKL